MQLFPASLLYLAYVLLLCLIVPYFRETFFLPRVKNEFQVPKWPIKFQQANLSGITYLDCNPFSHYFFCKTLLWLSGRRLGLAIGLSWVRVPQSYHYLDLFLGRPGSQILSHACK